MTRTVAVRARHVKISAKNSQKPKHFPSLIHDE
jgi:hypothetical protein